MNAINIRTRLEQLEAAICRHREEKTSMPACTCWLTETQKLDSALYASLNHAGAPELRVALLEEAISMNQLGKKGMPDCPCWANAPQMVDAELFAVLNEV